MPVATCELSDYEIIKRLGEGSLAEAHLAKDRDGRPVVLKVLLKKWRGDLARRVMLQEEGELLAASNHPGLRRCYAFCGDPPAQVLEYIDGAPLSGFLAVMREDGKQFESERALEIVQQISIALAYLHDRDVCHFDITPDNILIARDGRVVLVDLARGRWPGRRARIEYEPIPGKLGYCAPELWKGKPLGSKSDIYQLGVLLWEILAGRPPEFVSKPKGRKALPALRKLIAYRKDLDPSILALQQQLCRREPNRRPNAEEIMKR